MDSNVVIVFAHLLFFGVIAFLAMAITHWRRDIIEFYYNRVLFRNYLSKGEYRRIDQTLNKHFGYYSSLSADGKSRFIQRVFRFSQSREFVGMNGLRVTPLMRLLISSSAVQLTFGLRDFNLRFLEEIRIFPQPFTYGYRRQSMKGAVSPSGFMLLSWKDFLEGYADDNDNYNLGLHEMAHALKLEVTKADTFDLRFSSYIDRWLEVGEKAFFNLRSKKQSFLRNYGGTNHHEFFAVCVEHFFESPESFSKALPDVYNHLCKLLNQNPLNHRDDYRVTDSFKRAININPSLVPVPEKLRKTYPGDHFNRFHLFTAATLFFSIILYAFVSWKTVFDKQFVLIVALLAAFIAGWLQRRYLISFRVLNGAWYFFYGMALVVFSGILYLASNQILTNEENIRYHRIENVKFVDKNYYLRLEGGLYSDFPRILEVSQQASPQPQKGGVAAFRFRTGCMGMPVLQDVRYGREDEQGRFVQGE